eukprot:comp19880_c1_seq1/m.24046 comp19880_c1_seq1/g.24046  ORF comp19880_c1_seq1/g.24046 comp19880_c1_seq1/m.24046 type:complete len:333 (-) comp19880_c1_seq1:999-1997(-)
MKMNKDIVGPYRELCAEVGIDANDRDCEWIEFMPHGDEASDQAVARYRQKIDHRFQVPMSDDDFRRLPHNMGESWVISFTDTKTENVFVTTCTVSKCLGDDWRFDENAPGCVVAHQQSDTFPIPVDDALLCLKKACIAPRYGEPRIPGYLLVAARFETQFGVLAEFCRKVGMTCSLEDWDVAKMNAAKFGTDPYGFNNRMRTSATDPRLLAVVFKNDGNEAFKKKKFNEAIKFYTKGINCLGEDDEDTYLLYSNRCACYMQQKKYAEALADAVTITTIKPTWEKGFMRLARAHEELGNLEDAVIAWAEACRLSPENAEYAENYRKAKDRCKK